MKCETVLVVSDNKYGCVLINKEDFDEDVHVLYGVESIETFDDVTEDDVENMTKKELVAYAKTLEGFELDEKDTVPVLKEKIIDYMEEE